MGGAALGRTPSASGGRRIFVIVRPDALSPRLRRREVYETPRPGGAHDVGREPSPFDLEI